MTKGKKATTLLAAMLVMSVLACLWASPASAYDTGRKWAKNSSSWPLYRVYMDYRTLSSSWRTATYNARMEWNNKGASKEYFYYDSTGYGHDVKSGSYGTGKALGWTLAIGSPIYDADITLNLSWNMSTGSSVAWNQYDGQAVVLHELGHVLELHHSTVSSATMRSALPAGTTAYRSLASDDINGIRALYGNK
jgi:hypothetical protein